MASSLINALSRIVQNVEQTVVIILTRGFPPGPSYVIDRSNLSNQCCGVNSTKYSLNDILDSSILWAVPTHRRTIEKRWQRKFGVPKYFWKLHIPKKLLTCITCGHDHEPGRLCGHCYERVKVETKEMQEAIQANLGLSPIEENVIVLYEGEMQKYPKDQWKDQRIIELPKKRPQWFHENLLQPTTQEPSSGRDIKPANLT